MPVFRFLSHPTGPAKLPERVDDAVGQILFASTCYCLIFYRSSIGTCIERSTVSEAVSLARDILMRDEVSQAEQLSEYLCQ